jgi:glutathione S-transferase
VQKPEEKLLAEPKTTARYKTQQALNWVASELHAASGPLFAPGLSDEIKAFLVKRLEAKYKTLNDLLLANSDFLVGDSFTVADSYCYIVTTWTPYLGVDLAAYPKVHAYQERCKALPFVKSAHEKMATSPTHTA